METQAYTTRPLAVLENGASGVIIKVAGHGAFRKRITEMGFVKGKTVRVIKNAPLEDPVEYEIMGYRVSLRRSEARSISVAEDTEKMGSPADAYSGTIGEGTQKLGFRTHGDTITVALVGNPNSGKTSLFNYASGLHERVGNYGGVTVDAKEGIVTHGGYTLEMTDLPGTYSITEYTSEELFVRRHIQESMPDVVVNVVDASNLERNLFLTTQLIDMNIKVVIALNMYDEFQRSGARLDYRQLGAMLGIPIIPTVAMRGEGLTELVEKIIDVYEDRDPVVRHIHINYGTMIERSIARIQTILKAAPEIADAYSTRYLAIKLLEGDATTLAALSERRDVSGLARVVDREVAALEKEYGERSETVLTDAKYGFIDGALAETMRAAKADERRTTREIDTIITHKLFGFPIFILFMWAMFQATFTLGSYPMDWIDAGVGLVGEFVARWMPDGALKALIVDGVIGGVGGVIIFLPNILILFFCISLMEDTGYMARVSFIMDRLMHKLGLHGKSFIPLLMGFGCNVPAIMATRTLEHRKDRILTMLIIPFMSCSARLPVYVLLISAFFPHNQGLVLLSLYGGGIVIAVVSALLLKQAFFAKEDAPFVMELPPYRIPTLRNTMMHMWYKSVQYLQKMGGVILLASILIWALSYYPQRDPEKIADSYIGRLGHAIEPVIRPLGFDWKIGVSLLTGVAAKEIVVSTMGILYQAGPDADETSGGLVSKLREQEFTEGPRAGQKVFSMLTAYCMMFFVLIYFPCVAVITAVRKESSRRWALFTVVYTTLVAYIITLAIAQIGGLFT